MRGLLTAHLDSETKDYLRTFFESHHLELRAKAAGGVQPNLNLSILKNTVVPLPPQGEAVAVCEAVVIRQSQLAALSLDCSTWEKHTAALRQKVLSFAFEGRLVVQQSTDEPASALLARIASEPRPAPARQRS